MLSVVADVFADAVVVVVVLLLLLLVILIIVFILLVLQICLQAVDDKRNFMCMKMAKLFPFRPGPCTVILSEGQNWLSLSTYQDSCKPELGPDWHDLYVCSQQQHAWRPEVGCA